MNLTEWLLAELAEDERVARAATTRGGSTVYTDARRGGKQAVLDHVMRHDPARVLADCAAKRRIVERHRRCDAHTVPGDCDACLTCGDGSLWPCDDVLALASVYADRPGYRDEWRL